MNFHQTVVAGFKFYPHMLCTFDGSLSSKEDSINFSSNSKCKTAHNNDATKTMAFYHKWQCDS